MTIGRADGLILFGITGDLAHRRLFPALYELAADGELDHPVVGVGRTEGDDNDLRQLLSSLIVQFCLWTTRGDEKQREALEDTLLQPHPMISRGCRR